MIRLDPSEISFASLSLVDDRGRVFTWNGRLFRAIRSEMVGEIRELLASGLLEELRVTGLFPATTLTDYELEGYGLVLEHEVVPAITYPFEWSFSMLQAAALTVIEVSQVARKFGYELKDCHGYNVAFHRSRAMYLDLGSFVKMQPGAAGWRAYEEFVQSYLYPLELWRSGNHFIAQRLLADQSLMPHESYLLYRYPVLRKLGPMLRNLAKLQYVYYKGRVISSYPEEMLRERLPTQLEPALDAALFLKGLHLLPLQTVNFDRLAKRVKSVERTGYTTTWGDYHDGLIVDDLANTTPRFRRIVELVRTLDAKTAVELAGNQGALSHLLLKETQIERVICSDIDESAVDRMFLRNEKSDIPLLPTLLDFMIPIAPRYVPAPNERFRSDIVLALAVTHHLLLKPPFFAIDQVLRAIASYSRKYVFVEFMAKGLFDGKGAPRLPAWYTAEWFRDAFNKVCTLLHEEQLEENRLLFVGEIRIK
jgi:hypothetical protein